MRRCAGMKLAELVVVLTILLLVAAIITPVVISVRKGSLRSQCMSNLRQIGIATQLYPADYQALYESMFQLAAYLDLRHPKERGILACPAGRLQVPLRKAVSSYSWNTSLLGVSRQRLQEESPNRVLVDCEHHLGLPLRQAEGWASYDYTVAPSYPFLLTLRLDGFVQTVHACQVRAVEVGPIVVEGRTLEKVLQAVYPGETEYEKATIPYPLYELSSANSPPIELGGQALRC
ncbi:MAG: DUF1559 domain-containing protein [Fimbriimonadales bacterium]|nr:DUF1559 domain-containing protein [Fimbriimonadales bacterium]